MIEEGDQTVAITQRLVIANDSRLAVSLDWIILRNGLGSWCTDADWDEYIVTVANRSESSIRIESVRLVDGLGETAVTSGQHKRLIKQSKQTARRFKDHDIEVKAGVGGDELMTAGHTVAVASAATGVAVLSGSAATSAVATGAVLGGILVVAPVLIAAGAVNSSNEATIAREIIDRQAELPHRLKSSQTETLHFFFPITPSPTQLEVVYRTGIDEFSLFLITSYVLKDLHVGN